MGKQYAELVTQAESAVTSIKDAELRRVAFEKVLDDLLSDDGIAGKASDKASVKKQVSRTSPRKTSAQGNVRPARNGPKGHVVELCEEGFFGKPKTISQVQVELANRGHHIPQTSLSGPLQSLCQQKILRRQKIDGTFQYSNW